MATISFPCFRAIFLGALIILCLPHPFTAVPLEELERAITVLRLRGRALFANAIITSDLLFDLLSVESLTLFGPTDSMLFALDMTHSLPFYVSTLRLHSVPLRLPFSDLRSLPNASSLPTLLPSHRLILTRPSSSNDSIYLDDVHIILPGLFYGENLAVHGLADLLPLRSPPPPPPHPSVDVPPMVDTPAESTWSLGSRISPAPDPYVAYFGPSPAETPRVEEVSPTPEPYVAFFGRSPAETPRVEEVSPTPEPYAALFGRSPAETPSVEEVSPTPAPYAALFGRSPTETPSVEEVSPSPDPYAALFGRSPAETPRVEEVSPTPDPYAALFGRSPAETPRVEEVPPTPEPYAAFFGRSPAETPRVEKVPPSPWGDFMFVGDEGGPLDGRTDGF